MPDLTRETIADLRRLREAATPGEWEAHDDAICYSHEIGGTMTLGWFVEAFDAYSMLDNNEAWPAANAALVAAVINALPALLAAAERGLDVEDGR